MKVRSQFESHCGDISYTKHNSSSSQIHNYRWNGFKSGINRYAEVTNPALGSITVPPFPLGPDFDLLYEQ